LLNAFNSELNGENNTVLFSYNKFDSVDFLTDRVLATNISKEVEIREHETGELLATATSMNAAGLIIGKYR
jgi:hypothetical protein